MGRNYQWASPDVIDKMFIDGKDHHGLLYWFDDIQEQHKQYEALKPKT